MVWCKPIYCLTQSHEYTYDYDGGGICHLQPILPSNLNNGKIISKFSREYLSFNFNSTCSDVNNLTIPKHGKKCDRHK
jgi:hypothetical protein